MAKWGKADFRQLQRLQKKMEKLERAGFEKFCEDCTKELAARLLAKVIKRTPVGQYPDRAGGVLRRGWTAESEREAELTSVFGGGTGGKRFADSLKVEKISGGYQIEIVNPVHYASYVEYGHRTRNHKGWVKGQFMLTISENELKAQAPKIIEKKLMKFLGGVFDGD